MQLWHRPDLEGGSAYRAPDVPLVEQVIWGALFAVSVSLLGWLLIIAVNFHNGF